jgi:hypothetical protein
MSNYRKMTVVEHLFILYLTIQVSISIDPIYIQKILWHADPSLGGDRKIGR